MGAWAEDEAEGDMDKQVKKETVAFNTIGKYPSDTLAYYPGLEHHHSTTSTLGVQRGRLEREIERYYNG